MKIFISYAHADKLWLDQLLGPIQRVVKYHAGDAEIFTDRKIDAGEDWHARIRDEIRQADLVILLGTAAFANSQYITESELPLILERQAQGALFPILVTSVFADHVPALASIQWIPEHGLAEAQRNERLDEVLLAVQNRLGERISGLRGRAARPAIGLTDAGASESFPVEQLESLDNLREAPLARFIFHGLGRNQYAVDVECIKGSGPIDRNSIVISHDLGKPDQAACDSILNNQLTICERMLEPLLQTARSRFIPLRVQLVFSRSAYLLDQIDWESLRWQKKKGTRQYSRALGGCSDIVFSRQFAFPEADYGELQIKLKSSITCCTVVIDGQPGDTDGSLSWGSCFPISDTLAATFTKQWAWSISNGGSFDAFKQMFRDAEVVYLSLAAGVSGGSDPEIRIPLPDSTGVQLMESKVGALGEMLFLLKVDQPSLVILAPRQDANSEVNRLLAFTLATARVPAVLAPVGDVPEAAWNDVLIGLLKDLDSHGVIDLAVSVARLRARQHGFGLQLYLRTRSARLWYEPAFVTVRGTGVPAPDVWTAMRSQFGEGNACPDCVVLVGANLDRTLSLSRRDMAQEMAKMYGFALSRKDREDLETVAEYVHVSQPRNEDDMQPHVTAFVNAARNHLVKQLSPGQYRTTGDDLDAISRCLRTNQPVGTFDPFDVLGRLKVASFMTVYFHQFIEDSLRANGRTPVSLGFRRINDTPPGEFDMQPTLANPLVYHCFGSFSDSANILVSKSDYLDFFAEYCLRRDELTVAMRGLLGVSTLLILGFRPNSSDLRMLLAVYRMIKGRRISQKRVHIAVQIDPEDDHTIDPDGARAYYQGLLAELGSDVYLYWGTPEQFLTDFQDNCPQAFLGAPA